MSSDAAMVEQFRSFSRTVTERVGALNDRFMERNRPLAQSRMLWEIGLEGCEIRLLRSRLGLDSGHASRLLRSLEAEGLVVVEPSVSDRRVRMARLTARGRHERALLDERSDTHASTILAALDPARREQLVGAMRTVERLLTAAAVEIRMVDPAGRDAQRCLSAYYAELNRRSDKGYDPKAGISAEPYELSPPAGAFFVAYLHGEAIGCGGVKHHDGAPAEIKRMWVAESARGLGVGRRMLACLEECARDNGAATAHIETNGTLVEAISLYLSAGYVEVPAFNHEPFADHWFEKSFADVEAHKLDTTRKLPRHKSRSRRA
jgi:DNA-binding MarR family transcriptional regulator/GNAT superfamily N-acetyltransferase